MSTLLGMVFVFCSQIAEAGGIIVPGRQRAKRSPAPSWGCGYDLGAGGGLGTSLNRPGSFEEVPRAQVILACCWKTNV